MVSAIDKICIPYRPWDERLLSKITRPKTVGEYEYCLLKMSIKKMNYTISDFMAIIPSCPVCQLYRASVVNM